MEYKNLRKLFIGTLLLFVGYSCQKELSSENGNLPNNTQPVRGIILPISTPINGSVAGRVVDENEIPVSNAEVTIANTTYFTNSNGFFNTSVLVLDKYLTSIKVKKQGYFIGYRNFSANASKNYVSIKLVPKILVGTFASTNNSNISLSNGTQISFLANSIKNKNTNVQFNGLVKVYAKFIDPTSRDISSSVPGSFIGLDSGKLFSLQSKGMIAVELESSTGAPLQILTTKPASIIMPIPASLQNSAPSLIATWSLNDNGIWIRESNAIKNGNSYEMQVTHFSFWNLDVPIDPIYLTMNVKNQNGINLSNTLVQLQTNLISNLGASYGFTDSLGNVSGFVPKNEVLAATIFASALDCTSPLFTQNIGPFSSNTNINIIATLTTQQFFTVTGNAIDCSSTAVSNGTAVIYAGGNQMYYTSILNGTFSIGIPHCNSINSVKVVAIDNNSLMQSDSTIVNINGNMANVGILNTCSTPVSHYINYTIDGANYVLLPMVNDNISARADSNYNVPLTGIARICTGFNCSYIFNLTLVGNSVGTFQIDGNCGLHIKQFYSFNMPTTGSTTYTAYGNIGQDIEGSFNIPFVDNTDSLNHLLTGTFKLTRTP